VSRPIWQPSQLAAAERRAGTYDPALDGLRAVAILLVMMRHFAHVEHAATPSNMLLRAFAAPGWVGVDLFFVLSGFLITGICLEHRGPGFFRAFYMRRGLRIVPAYAIVLTIVLSVALFVAPPVHGGWALATFSANFALAYHGTWRAVPVAATHFWSLAVEEQFYILWPWLAALLSCRSVARLALVAVPAAFIVRLVLNLANATRLAAFVLMPARMDTLAIGAALAVAVRDPTWRAVLEPFARRLAGVAGRYWMAGLVLVLLSVTAATGDGEPYGVPLQVFGLTVIALLCGVTVAAVALGASGSALRLALSRPRIVAIGRYSYAMYLIHVPVNVAITGLWHQPDGVFSAFVVASIGSVATFALAVLSWHFIESPALALKRFAPYGRESGEPVPALVRS
jgi:peptidoglycan/LPS O-acetylase OafA/YrhL